MLTPRIAAQTAQDIRHAFDQARSVVITCHASPDGDAIGASLALRDYFLERGRQANVVVPNYFPDFLHWMDGADTIVIHSRKPVLARGLIARADLLVALDYNDPARLEDLAPLFTASTAVKVMVDHHTHPTPFVRHALSIPSASSTCEILYRLLVAMGHQRHISLHAAEDLYAGMCTDTGRFSYNSNDPDIFLIIAELLRCGIDKDRIVRRLYNQNTEGRYRLMGHILLNRLTLRPDLHAAYYAVTRDELQQFHYVKGDAEGIVNLPLEIRGIRLVIALREDTEKPQVCVSIRSVDDFPANELAARFFNGGGHLNAAGGRLSCSIDEALRITGQAIEAFRDRLADTPGAPAAATDGTRP